jgi:hypothetical protein
MKMSTKPNTPMQRPVMDPTFVDLTLPTSKRVKYWQVLLRVLKWFGRSLLNNPLAIRSPLASDGAKRPSIAKILVRMVVSWAVFLPVLTGLMAFALVVLATHPTPPPTILDPNSQGCFFDQVSFNSQDGTSLSGWLVPAIDAKRVLSERDKVLRSHRPGIVLVHDFGQSPQQLLPLVKPLHDEGLNVLVVALRGSGSARATGQTFGLNEAKDVAAAVGLLKQTPFVDSNRIALAGIGSGGNAAMLAAANDPSIKAIIIANPLKDCDQALSDRVAPHEQYLRWLEPVCRWTFELMYGVNSDDLNYQRSTLLIKSRPSLVFDSGSPYAFAERANIDRIRSFCRHNLHTEDHPSIGSAR